MKSIKVEGLLLIHHGFFIKSLPRFYVALFDIHMSDSTTLFSASSSSLRAFFSGRASLLLSWLHDPVETFVADIGRFLGGRFFAGGDDPKGLEADSPLLLLDARGVEPPLVIAFVESDVRERADVVAVIAFVESEMPDCAALAAIGIKRSPSLTTSSPSRMGRRHKRSSLISSFVDSTVESDDATRDPGSVLLLSFSLDPVVDLPSPPNNSASSGAISSLSDRVLMEEVTSHQIVVKSSRIRQILQVGASGLGRPSNKQ